MKKYCKPIISIFIVQDFLMTSIDKDAENFGEFLDGWGDILG